MAADAVVLNYHDSLLRQSDLQLLQPGQWLNDRIIGFVFEYFEFNGYSHLMEHICFVSPEVTQFIKLSSGDDVGVFLLPLSLHQKSLVFFAVNNNESTEVAGGSHWSLLVYSRLQNACFHYDSWHGNNSSTAQRLATKVTPFTGSHNPKFIEAEAPQQDNSSDCGVYVAYLAEEICKQIATTGDHQAPVKISATPSSAMQKRLGIAETIQRLHNEGYV